MRWSGALLRHRPARLRLAHIEEFRDRRGEAKEAMGTPTVDQASREAARVFADPTAYADKPRLHAALAHLRAHAPVARVDCAPYRPFWALTKHADITEI